MMRQNRLINTMLDAKVIVGIIISSGGIYWAFKDFKFQEFVNSILNVNYFYLLIATLFLWGSVWLRALRWRWLFKQDVSPTTESLYRSEMIGNFGNNILPLRLGELMRAYLIGQEWNLSKKYVFGTIVLERLLDILSLVFFSFLLIFFYPLEESIREYIIWSGVVASVSIMMLLVILHHVKEANANNKILIFLKQMINGVLSIRRDALMRITIVSILIWSIYYLDVYLLNCAFGLDLSFPRILMVLVLSSLALALPSAPGMIGTFHAAVKYSMVDLFGFAPHVGNAFAIFMHAYGYILFTLLGAYYFMKNQFHESAIRNSIDTDLNQD